MLSAAAPPALSAGQCNTRNSTNVQLKPNTNPSFLNASGRFSTVYAVILERPNLLMNLDSLIHFQGHHIKIRILQLSNAFGNILGFQ